MKTDKKYKDTFKIMVIGWIGFIATIALIIFS